MKKIPWKMHVITGIIGSFGFTICVLILFKAIDSTSNIFTLEYVKISAVTMGLGFLVGILISILTLRWFVKQKA